MNPSSEFLRRVAEEGRGTGPTNPSAKGAEIKALLQTQDEASANLKVKLNEIENLL
jgi:hypothetical protein